MMTAANTQKKWLESYRRLTEEAEAFRDSQSVAFGLLDVYDKFSPAEKIVVHKILAEWLMSNDNKLRYDAQFVISERRIVEMAAAVQNAIEKSDEASGPEAKYETKKLRRILAELS